MVDGCSETWWTHFSMLSIVRQVKLGDSMSGEEHRPDAIGSCRPDSHLHALEGLGHLVNMAKYADPALVPNTAYQSQLVCTPRLEGPRETVFGSPDICWPE